MNRIGDILKRNSVGEKCGIYSLLLLTFEALPVFAESAHQQQLKLRVGVEYSDNSLRDPDPLGVEEFEINPALDLNYRFNNQRLNASVKYTLEHRNYSRDTQDNRSDLLGTGDALFTLVDQNLFWKVYHDRSRLLVDSQLPNVQSNQTERQLLQTGPSLKLNFRGDRSLDLNLSYIENTFSSGITNESEQGRFDFQYQQPLTTSSSLGLSGQYADVSSALASQDYKSARLGIDFNFGGRYSTYSLSVGGNTIERDAGLSFTGTFLSFSALINVDGTAWNLGVNRELTDSSIGVGLSSNLLDDFSMRDSDFNNSDIIERTRVEASFSRDLIPGRWATSIKLFSDKQDYQTLLIDRRSLGGEFSLRYNSSRRLRFNYRLTWGNVKADTTLGIAERSTDISNRLECIFSYNESLNLMFSIADSRKYFESHIRDYDELAVGMTVEFQI